MGAFSYAEYLRELFDRNIGLGHSDLWDIAQTELTDSQKLKLTTPR